MTIIIIIINISLRNCHLLGEISVTSFGCTLTESLATSRLLDSGAVIQVYIRNVFVVRHLSGIGQAI